MIIFPYYASEKKNENVKKNNFHLSIFSYFSVIHCYFETVDKQ